MQRKQLNMDSQTLSSKIASIKGIPEKSTLETLLLGKTYQIRFKKLDGDERNMTCTKQEKLIPQNRLPKNKSNVITSSLIEYGFGVLPASSNPPKLPSKL